ncbi:PREDICTED: uncharacterized protein LOC109164763 [Ipomoea nil]|uniref:uncharacterized protein LOC109164763 n=1 Tax=Ipomoea nil TaxID=35883 RepID=UPI0009018C40|nr:PREDICTED: uncharacterized protein LOC109164763 [Ipomoea nil]
MGSNAAVWCLITSLFLSLQYFSSFANPIDSLDLLIHSYALNALVNQRRPRTGALYNATLPASLAGMKLSVVRLRSKTLWRKGANFSNFHIPPKTLPVPYVKRVAIVCHDLGNWSSEYFNLSVPSGYSLLTSVVGFMIYDSSSKHLNLKNLTRLDLNITAGQPISIEFKNVSTGTMRGNTKICATFDGKGKVVFLSGLGVPNVCYTRNLQGRHYFCVIKKRKVEGRWGFWVIGFGVGVVGLGAAGLAGKFLHGIVKAKKNCEMEKEAEEGELMESIWIYNSTKMPRAMVTRTHPAPVIDNSSIH